MNNSNYASRLLFVGLATCVFFLSACNLSFPPAEEETDAETEDNSIAKTFAKSVENVDCKTYNAQCLAHESLPKEVKDILAGKQYIERNTEDLTNPFFETVPVWGHLHQPHRLMEPLDPKKVKQVELYGYQAVVLKPGHEALAKTVPRYVIFHEPITPDFLKAENYETLWVDQKDPHCISETKEDPKISGFGTSKHPSCKISTLIQAYCKAARIQSYIIRVKGGTYIESGDIRLCNRMILTNYNNETVKVTTFQDIKAGTPDGKWQLIDKANNVWAVNWMSNISVERWNGKIGLTIDDQGVPETPHWNSETLAPDWQKGFMTTFQTDPNTPMFHWMTMVKYLPHLEASYTARLADMTKKGLLLRYGSEVENAICKNMEPASAGNIANGIPTYELLPGVGAPMRVKTKYNGLNAQTCDIIAGHEAQAVDNRNVCHWTTPHPKLQGQDCEINYMALTRYHVNQIIWKPEFCSKLPGSPERCLILRLPPGKAPSDYQSIEASSTTEKTAFGVMSDWDFTHRNILLSGILFENYFAFFQGQSAWNSNPALIALGPGDRYFFKMDGNDLRAATPLGFSRPQGLYLENNHITRSGIMMLWSGDPISTKIIVRNNFFDNNGAKNISIEDWGDFAHPEKYPNDNCAMGKRIEYNTHYRSGIMNSGHMLGWCVENNYVYRGGSQEVIETGHIINTRIAQNWIEDSAHTGFGPDASGVFPDQIMLNTRVENNQFIKLMGRGIDGKGAYGTCAKVASFPGNNYLYGKCDNFTFQNNLIAEADGGGCVQGLVTGFCKNATIRNNTFAAPKDPSIIGMYVLSFLNRTENFVVRDNLFLAHEKQNSSPMFHMAAGESLASCKAKFKNEQDRCLSIADSKQQESCLTTATQQQTKLCLPDLDKKVAEVMVNPASKQYTFENNFFGKCSAVLTKNGFCPMGAGGFTSNSQPQFENPEAYNYRMTNVKHEDLGDGFQHIGVHYAEELYPDSENLPDLSAEAEKWDIEMLFDQVKKGRGEK